MIFSVSTLALLAFVYISAANFIEQQTQDTIDAEITGLVEQYQARGLIGLRQVIEARAAAAPDRRSVYLLESRFATYLAGNVDRWPATGITDDEGFRFKVLVAATGKQHTVLARRFRLSNGSRLLVGRDIEDRLAIQNKLMNGAIYGSGVMLLLALAGGMITSRMMLGRINRMNRSVSSIMRAKPHSANDHQSLSDRVALHGGGDEFDNLARNLNSMLDRIQRLVQGMREVSDNIAHDLRTPLNRMRGRLEDHLRNADHDPETARLAQETMHDCDQLIATFNALLSIARAEAGARDRWAEFDLAEIIGDAIDLYEPLAEEAGVELKLHSEMPPKGPIIHGDRQLLSQALANMIDNALKYAASGKAIEVGFDTAPSFWVADRGPGIPAGQHQAVFARFTRLEEDRSSPGNGLGLSLVQAVAHLHEAELVLLDNAPGLKIVMRLPQDLRIS